RSRPRDRAAGVHHIYGRERRPPSTGIAEAERLEIGEGELGHADQADESQLPTVVACRPAVGGVTLEPAPLKRLVSRDGAEEQASEPVPADHAEPIEGGSWSRGAQESGGQGQADVGRLLDAAD